MKEDPLYEIKSLQNEILRRSFNRLKERGITSKPLSHVQVRIIEYLCNNQDKDISQKSLEVYLNIRKSTLSGILNTMQKNDIIKRIDSTTDLRSKKIELTEDAKKEYVFIQNEIKALNNSLIKGIPKEKLKVFYEVVNIMKNNIN